MSLLLDTHAFAWFFLGDDRLPRPLRDFLETYEADIFVSSISAYEMAQKHRLGLWPEVKPLLAEFDALTEKAHFMRLSFTAAHAIRAGLIKAAHRDPFDRMLAAQAMLDRLTLVSKDRRMADLGAQVVWR